MTEEQQDNSPTQGPASTDSETTRRSRSLTKYVLLVGWDTLQDEPIEARTPEAAIEAAEVEAGIGRVAAVPESALHVFERTQTFKRVV